MKQQEKQATLALQRQRRLHEHKVNSKENISLLAFLNRLIA